MKYYAHVLVLTSVVLYLDLAAPCTVYSSLPATARQGGAFLGPAHAQCGARVAHRCQLEAQLVSASRPPGEDTVRPGASMGLPAAQ